MNDTKNQLLFTIKEGKTMENNGTNFTITPDTKLSDLFNHFPELEKILFQIVPEYEKLGNPILRETIIRVTSIRQVAEIGSVPIAEIINRLRSEAGIHVDANGEEETKADRSEQPEWLNDSNIVKKLDARKMLEAGEHPVNQVLSDVKELEKEQIYELITPFLPIPLIDRIKDAGFLAWSKQVTDDLIVTYFTSAI